MTVLVCGIFAAISLTIKNVDPLDELIGIYRGSYTATQGITGLTLDVYRNSAGIVEASFEFYPDPRNPYYYTDSGKYLCSVSFDSETSTYSLIGFRWVEQVPYYVFADLLDGVLANGKFTGGVYVLDVQYGNFDVSRI